MGTKFKLSCLAVGPQKTSTTWLYNALCNHPALCFPKHVKETMFFDLYYSQGLSRYESYFSHRLPSQLCAEIAPTYFDVPEVAPRVYQLNPQCKILINLRHPAQRAFSLYCHHLRKGRVPENFEQAIEKMPRILSAGRYQQHILTWLKIFEEKNLKLIVMDDIKTNPISVISQVCEFIGISENELPSNIVLGEKVNEASMPRFPWLAKTAAQSVNFFRANQFDLVIEIGKSFGLKKIYSGGESRMPKINRDQANFLIDYYQDDISYLEIFLDRDLSSWKTLHCLEDKSGNSFAAKI